MEVLFLGHKRFLNKKMSLKIKDFCLASSDDFLDIGNVKFNAFDFDLSHLFGWKRKYTDLDGYKFCIWVNARLCKIIIFKNGFFEFKHYSSNELYCEGMKVIDRLYLLE